MEERTDRMKPARSSLQRMSEMICEAVARMAVMNRMNILKTKSRDTKPKPARNRDKIKAARKQRNKK